ncbi:MAG: ABC transporter permease [Vicinamibacterales bacterium]
MSDESRVSGTRWADDFLADLRYGFRTLVAHRGFAALAVLTLGLGIGANTAIFSVINGVLLKPLPYDNGDRLLLVRHSAPLADQQNVGVSIKELYDYREQLASFDGLVEFHQMNFDLLRRGDPDRVATGVVSPNFFNVLGIQPLHGRTFVEADDTENAEAVLVLGHTYWQSRFGGDPGIVGQVFQMNDRPHTVIGVLPPVPHYPNEVDVYMPTKACPFRAAAERQIETNRRAFSNLQVFGLLKPDASPQTAQAEVVTVGQRFRQDFPEVYRPERTGFQTRTAAVLDELTTDARPMLLILLGATGLVLLIACANVANLTLARMLRRNRELALRSALGAGRGRLVRQLLTESTLIAVAGGIVGLVFAWSTLDMLSTFIGRFTARTGEITLDPWVLLFALAISVLTGLIFGTFPALASRLDLASAMKASGKGSGGGAVRHRLQSGLIIAQVAVSVVLLVGAGLLLLSFLRLQRVDAGYRGDRVLTAEIFGNFTKYPAGEAQRRLYLSVLDRLQSAPGVVTSAITNSVPLSGAPPGQTRFQISGNVYETPDLAPTADVRVASPQYFDTLSVPLLRGRVFTELDHEDATRVLVINEAMTPYWEGRDPIGTDISLNDGETWSTVVGIVGNVRSFGLDREAVGQIYQPLRQATGAVTGRILVRGTGDPMALATAVRSAVQAIDPDLPIENVQTLDTLRDRTLATPRLTATLLTIFAGLALVVTVAGITGVVATAVSQRTQEFGVRMALGASRTMVLRTVLGEGLMLVAIGLGVGFAVSLGLVQVLRAYLYETAPTDPITFAAVSVAFLVAGGLATLGPALRATTVDPMVALRAE